MKKDKEKTKVIFKVAHYPDGGPDEVLAFFPGAEANRGFIQGYAHVGQHSEASYDFYYSRCRPCRSPREYRALKHELEDNFGYNFKVVKRVTAQDRKKMWRLP